MHCVLLGVCRQLLKLWNKSSNHKESWYLVIKLVLRTNSFYLLSLQMKCKELHAVLNLLAGIGKVSYCTKLNFIHLSINFYDSVGYCCQDNNNNKGLEVAASHLDGPFPLIVCVMSCLIVLASSLNHTNQDSGV